MTTRLNLFYSSLDKVILKHSNIDEVQLSSELKELLRNLSKPAPLRCGVMWCSSQLCEDCCLHWLRILLLQLYALLFCVQHPIVLQLFILSSQTSKAVAVTTKVQLLSPIRPSLFLKCRIVGSFTSTRCSHGTSSKKA